VVNGVVDTVERAACLLKLTAAQRQACLDAAAQD
jgi:hypothetical protein